MDNYPSPINSNSSLNHQSSIPSTPPNGSGNLHFLNSSKHNNSQDAKKSEATSKLHIQLLHERLLEQERNQSDFLKNMYKMQQELASNLKKTEMSQLQESYQQRAFDHQIHSLTTSFMNLQGQIVQLMRQMEIQKEIAIGGIELFKQKNQVLQEQVSNLQYQLQQEQEKSFKLGQALTGQQDKVYHAFKQMNDHVEDKLKTIEHTFSSQLNNLQQQTSQAFVNIEAKWQLNTTSLHQNIETKQEKDYAQVEIIRQELANKIEQQQQQWEKYQELTKEFSLKKFEEIQSKLSWLDTQHSLSHRIPKLESQLLQLHNSLQATTHHQEQLLDTSVQDIVTAMDILKQTVHLIKNEDIQARKSFLDDMKKMKTELSLELVKVRDQLRKEMRYIEKPLLIV